MNTIGMFMFLKLFMKQSNPFVKSNSFFQSKTKSTHCSVCTGRVRPQSSPVRPISSGPAIGPATTIDLSIYSPPPPPPPLITIDPPEERIHGNALLLQKTNRHDAVSIASQWGKLEHIIRFLLSV